MFWSIKNSGEVLNKLKSSSLTINITIVHMVTIHFGPLFIADMTWYMVRLGRNRTVYGMAGGHDMVFGMDWEGMA